MSDANVGLGAVFKSLRTAWASLLILTFAGLLVGLVVAFLIPPEWEVTALIEDACITSATSATAPTQANMFGFIKRLRSAETLEAVLEKAGYAVDKRHIKRLIADTSFAMVGNSVELRERAESYDKALELANDFLAEIQEQESETMAVELKAARDTLAATEQQRDELLKTLRGDSSAKTGAAANLLAASAIAQKDTAIQELRENLQPPRTQAARFLIPPSGLPWPVFPDKVLFGVLGALAGLGAGFVFAFSRPAADRPIGGRKK